MEYDVLAGENGGQIKNVHVMGSGKIENHRTVESVGGLVGTNFGKLIEESYATGNVSSIHKAGGLIGNVD